MKFIFLISLLYISPVKEENLRLQKLIDSIYHYIPINPRTADSLVAVTEPLLKPHHTSETKADFYLAKGSTSRRVGRSFEAIKDLYQALILYEKLQDTTMMIKTKIKICLNHHLLDEHQSAIKIAHETLALSEILDDSSLLYGSQYNLGRAYGWSQDNSRSHFSSDTIRKALMHFNKAKDFIVDWGDSTQYYPLFRGLGDAYIKLNEYQEATRYFKIFENNNLPLSQFLSAINLGMIQRMKGNYSEALDYFKIAEALALSINNDFNKEWLSREFSRLLALTGDYQKALEYRIKSEELEIKRLKANKNGAIANLTMAYEQKQKESQLAFQEQLLGIQQTNLKYQQNIIITIAISLLVSCAFVFFYYRAYQKNKIISSKNAHLVKEQNHRVKNNLQMISALLNMQSKRLIDQKTRDAFEESNLRIKSIGLIHQMLYGKNMELIEIITFIRTLTENVVNALSDENFRPVVNYDLENFSLPTDKMVPVGLILTELLTNSLKYAFTDHNDPKIFIRISKQSDQNVLFVYHDNGPGFIF